MSKAFYLTTTLPYVNADPHIGFALELVQADVIARYRKLLGDEVFFNTGTDEHGLKIFRKAQEEGKEPQRYVDAFAARFRALPEKLGLDPDLHFIRTTDAHHKAAAQEMWKRCAKDIYKKKYKGLYCVGDEAFVKETDLVNGRCPNHPTMDLIEIEEENYFFALSKYQDRLLKYLEQPGVIVPEWRRQEAIKFVQGGLEDFSVSRQKDRLPWGVPVPGDDSQVMYVWFDALTNYISTLGWPEDKEGNFEKFWTNGETLQLAGKDQVRFQSVMWQAMLMSAEVKTTDKVLYHGFITSGGQKMSKSIGNVIDPIEIVNEYGADALRYFLARHISPFEDSDFTIERFKEAYNADLANGLGNLVARVMTLAQQYLNEPAVKSGDLKIRFPRIFQRAMQDFDFRTAMDILWINVSQLNQDVNVRDDDPSQEEPETVIRSVLSMNEAMAKEQPFKLIKENSEEGRKIITRMAREVFLIAKGIEVFMPETSRLIVEAVLANKKPANLFPRKE